jgi:hypothetical protein
MATFAPVDVIDGVSPASVDSGGFVVPSARVVVVSLVDTACVVTAGAGSDGCDSLAAVAVLLIVSLLRVAAVAAAGTGEPLISVVASTSSSLMEFVVAMTRVERRMRSVADWLRWAAADGFESTSLIVVRISLDALSTVADAIGRVEPGTR